MMPSDERARADAEIIKRIAGLTEFESAEQILAYLALPDEPSLDSLLKLTALPGGTPVFVPTRQDRTHMIFVRWRPTDGFRAGPNGSWRPSSSEQPSEVKSVVLVPGRAFDPQGYRLGRGAGCYDRILDGISRFATVVGVAYDCQFVENVPREDHDRPVHVVVTERRTLRVRALC